jgi:rhodanese-related sulfurtransferase
MHSSYAGSLRDRQEVIRMSITTMRNEVKYFEDKLKYTVGPMELEEMIKSPECVRVIDVRETEDYDKGHVPGSINLPQDKWDTAEGLDFSKVNVMYCYTQQCHLATKACLKFARKGFKVMELEGGWAAWKEFGLTVETGSMRKAA